jgi:hypothetical protein
MGGYKNPGPKCQLRGLHTPIDEGTLALTTFRPPGELAEKTFRSVPLTTTVIVHALITDGDAKRTDSNNKDPSKKTDTKRISDKTPDSVSTGVRAGAGSGSGSTAKADDAAGSNQWSMALGLGYVGHLYLTHRGPDDPYKEAVMQMVAAYTRQFHKQNSKGWELMVPAQFQYSFTTQTPTFGTGLQLSYVKPFARNRWQVSGFVQALGAVAISAPAPSSYQFQPAGGLNLTYQPKDWLQISGQGAAGFTVQTHGPASFDYGFTLTLQVNI